MYFDGGVGGVYGHLFLDNHTVLNIIATGVYLLTADETVELGIFCNTPDIGGKQNVGDAEISETFPTFLANIAVNVGNFNGFFKEIGADVSFPLEIHRNLCHRGERTDAAAIDTVTPSGMVFAYRVNTDGKNGKQKTEGYQCVRQEGEEFTGKQQLAFQIQLHSKGESGQKDQKQSEFFSAAGGAHIGKGERNQHNGVQNGHQRTLLKAYKIEDVVGHQHSKGDSGFVKPLLAAGDALDGENKGCCDWQNDLVPHLKLFIGSFHTEKNNANHCRADHTNGHQPDQNAFATDIKMYSFIHNIHNIAEKRKFCKRGIFGAVAVQIFTNDG